MTQENEQKIDAIFYNEDTKLIIETNARLKRENESLQYQVKQKQENTDAVMKRLQAVVSECNRLIVGTKSLDYALELAGIVVLATVNQ